MLTPPSVRRVLLAVAGLVATFGPGVAAARAEIGEVGSPVVLTGKVSESSLIPHVLGVDPIAKSFFVGDEVEGASEAHYYRIQKFSATGEQLAEVRIKAKADSNSLSNLALEGVAIDSSEKRLYVLVDREREPEEEEPVFDPAPTPAAATLYAFSTEKLELIGTKGEGALTGLNPETEEPGVPLLDPHGISVDPTNHDIVIVGQEDEQTMKGPGHEPELRTVVQRVHPNGSLGPRYVDLTNCLDGGSASGGEPACEVEAQPFSPIVVSGGNGASEGRVYVEREKEIWEIPSSATELEHKGSVKRFETHPKRLLPTASRQEFGPEQGILEFPKANEGIVEETGGTMSFVPEGKEGEGKFYLMGAITTKNVTSASVLVLDYNDHGGVAEAKEAGWTGGQAEGSGMCSIPKKGNDGLLIAGGEKEEVFVLDAHGSPVGVDIFGFGPGGSGCPHAEATTPTVKVRNNLNEEVVLSPVPVGETAILSSAVTEGNAVRAEWKFKNLTTKEEEPAKEEGYEFQTTTLEHKFEHAGTYEVTETIETDDLASPKIVKTVQVAVSARPITVEFTYPATATVGKAAQFEATVNDPNESGTHHLKYEWSFGDGEAKSGETTGTAFAEAHTYKAPSAGESVTLKVTDGHGVSGEATHSVAVVEEKPPPPPPSTTSTEGPKLPPPPPAEPSPEVTLGSSSVSASASGGITLKVACPSGDTSCSGTVTLRTAEAVAASRRHKGKHKVVLTIATGSFVVNGGQVGAVTLHLSVAARALLARIHLLRAQAILVAHNPTGASFTKQAILTLHVAVKQKHHHTH